MNGKIVIAIIEVGILILAFGFLMLFHQAQNSRPDMILDSRWTGGEGNNMSGWSVGFTWMGDPEEFRNDIISGGFTHKVNGEGSFQMTLPLDEFALNLIGDTVTRIYYDGEPQFWGFMDAEVTISESDQTVTISGGDMMSRMRLRKVDYKAVTALGADPPRGDQGSKDVFDQLIHWYTGETDSDSMFRNEFIEYSETSYKYVYDGNDLMEALVDVAQSSSLTVDGIKKIGYACWVSGNGDIFLQPYGWKKYAKEIPGQWNITFDYGQIRNRVKLRGGIPDAIEAVDADGDGQFDYDMFEEPESSGDLTEWDVTGLTTWSVSCGALLDVDQQRFYKGKWSGTLGAYSIGTALSRIYVRRDFSPYLDWTYIDEYGATQTFFQGGRAWMSFNTGTNGIQVQLRIYDSSLTDYYYRPTMVKTGSGDITWFELGFTLENMTEVNTMDWSNIARIHFELFPPPPYATTSGTFFNFDYMAIFFKEVDIARRDENSILLHGLRESKFQDRRVTDWKTAGDVAQNILDLLRFPAVTASTEIPYYDSSLELNMLIEPVIQEVTWPLYINEINVNWSGDHVSTTIKAGRPIPDDDDIIRSLKLLRDQDSEKGTGFKTASQYDVTSCFKDEELFCRSDCMVSNCQNSAQLLSCFTFAERDLCKTICQRYKERVGWLDSLKDV